jgi:hypothetical protein
LAAGYIFPAPQVRTTQPGLSSLPHHNHPLQPRYCETDIVNTYRVWLRYELFRGRLSPNDFEASEQGLAAFLKGKEEAKPHLVGMAG